MDNLLITLKKRVGAFAFASSTILCSFSQAVLAENIIINGSFEDGFDHWELEWPYGELDDTIFAPMPDGDWCAYDAVDQAANYSYKFDAEVGATYHLSAWLSIKDVESGLQWGGMQMSVVNDETNGDTIAASATYNQESDWQKIELSFVAEKEKTKIQLRDWSSPKKIEACWDNVTLEKESNINKIHRIVTGANHSCFILEGGNIKCWGNNKMGSAWSR